MWVLISLSAGLLQTVRNGLARSLSGVLPATLLSWSRFAFNLPFAGALVAGLYLLGDDGAPALSTRFLALCVLGGAGQILGNVVLIEAFRSGTFAQAIVIHKTEVTLAAVVGFLFFSQVPSPLGWLGILLSALGVVLIGLASARPSTRDRGRGEDRGEDGGEDRGEDKAPAGPGTPQPAGEDAGPAVTEVLLSANRGTGLALASAGLLVVAGFGIQQATEELVRRNPGVDGTFGLAATTLFHVTWMEVVALTLWLVARERPALARVPDHLPRLAGIGFTSFAGSLGWFWAFSLSFVAFVKAVGQIESVLSVVLAIALWHEQRTRDQIPGIALTMVGILLIVLS